MKKILSMMILLAGVISFTSCGDDDPTYTAPEKLTLESAESFFKAKGGVATIVVNTTETVTATSSASWLTASVSGQTVTLTATPNTGLMGRSAYVTLTSASGLSTGVSVQQLGINLDVDESPIYIESDEAKSYTYDVLRETPGVVDITVSEDWLKAEIVNDQLVLTTTANPEGIIRKAVVTLKAEPFTKSIEVSQFEYNGTYLMMYYNNANKQKLYGYYAEIKDDAMNVEYDEDCVLSIPCGFDETTMTYTTGPCSSYMGMWKIYYIFLLYGSADGYYSGWSNTTSVSTIPMQNIESEEGTMVGGACGGKFGARSIDYWHLQALGEPVFDQAASAGVLERWWYPVIYKLTAEEASSRRIMRSSKLSFEKAPFKQIGE